MPDTRDPRSVLDAAEQAAANNDYESAERLLREAVSLQEDTVGPLHPDLANTLNNLAVVCEITNKPEDAEQFYRRAVAIATATLAPDHPDLTRSRKNLEDFCAARGRPVELPVAPAAIESEPTQSIESKSAEPRVIEPGPAAPLAASPDWHPGLSERGPTVVDEPRRYAGTIGIVVVAAAALLALIAVAMLWFRSNDAAPEPPERSTAAAPAEKAPPAAREPTAAAPKAPPVKKPASPEPSPAKQSLLVVATARLCQKFSTGGSGDWPCVPVTGPIAPGALVFYTRVKSPRDTTVEHRWYRGSELRHTRRLSIETNTGTGYRTYSRYTPEQSGDWRVELRSRDGALLHEERFVVR